MNISDFDFDFPKEQIALEPARPRDHARLLLAWNREKRFFHELPSLLKGNEVFVFNNTKVLPCRVFAKRSTGARVEIFILPDMTTASVERRWKCLVRPAKKIRSGEVVTLEKTGCQVRLEGVHTTWTAEPVDVSEHWTSLLQREGDTPLPPYIERSACHADREDYNTVFAEQLGAAAAPTAGLHFTHELVARLRAMGCACVTVTLHVGLGTFAPVEVEDIHTHPMHREWYDVSENVMGTVKQALKEGREVVCVGTTSLRALESALQYQKLQGWTDIFFRPQNGLAQGPHRPQFIRSLITNFHQPRSTLLMLVASMIGLDQIKIIYRDAVASKFRLFSYGDAMWIRA